ncbi:prepilin peptidase [Rubrobacter xylanophilus]|uniref:prepilin peptidase n=1 Tax=Rubrobacter xylanophilus TaxID=49319 RepID=UPI001F324BF7|nr:A24 family peptidase [Rubrobacter xylanophilus]
MLAAVAGSFGLVAGSFLNVVIHRVPRRESVVWPGSRCPRCGSSILARDNVPLLSYLLLRGRCRRCRVRIPVRYPLVEGITGALFAAAVMEFGLGVRLILALVLLAALVALAATDLEHRLLPNAVVLPAAAAGLILSAAAEPTRWWVYPLSALGVAGGLLALALARPGGMGMGDVKMGGMLGAFLGPYAFLAVFLGALGGTLVSGGLMALGKAGRESRLPFGTFMALGGAAALFFGPELWGLYLGLLR